MVGVCDATGAAPGVRSKPALKSWISTISIVFPGKGSAASSFLEIICTARVLLSGPIWSRYASYISNICALVTPSSAAASVSSRVELLRYSQGFMPVRPTLREIVIARPDLVPVIASFFRKVLGLLQLFYDKTPSTDDKILI